MRTPLKDIGAAALKRASPECRYLVTGSDGRVARAGTVPAGVDASFQVDLKDLRPGRYVFSALVAVNGNVMNAKIYRIPFVVSSQR